MKKFKEIFKDVLYVSRLTNIKRKKIRIIFSAIISNGISLADIAIILCFSNLLTNESVIENQYIELILDNTISIPIIVVIRYILNFLGKYNIFSLTKDIEGSLKLYLMKEVYKKGNYSLADATYYIETLSVHIAYFFNSFANIVSSIIQVLIFTIYLSYSNFQVLAIFIGAVVVLYYPTKVLLMKGRKAMDESWHFSQYSLRNIQRIVDNLYLIKILNTQKEELNNFDTNLKSLYKSEKRKFKYSDINSSVPNFIAVFLISIILVINQVRNLITLEFIGVTLRLVQSIGGINAALSSLFNTHIHLEKLFLIENNNQISNNFESKIDKDSDYSIDMQNLSFKFANSEELFFNNLSFQFKKDKHYIITGENGSGKSTLLGVLAGALNPEKGRVIRSSSRIGYIGASPLILEDSLRENLNYGTEQKISDSDLMKFIEEFKIFDDFDENILDKKITNKTLSSGQMQKVSFIRAFASGCDILFLDESTANLDKETKLQISQILSSKKITIINSTHNPEDFKHDFHFEIEVKNDKSRELLKP